MNAAPADSSRGSRALLIWCSVMATSFVTLEPLFVGRMVEQLELSLGTAGYLAAALVAASAGGNLLLIVVGVGRSLRRIVFASTAALMVTEFASVIAIDGSQLLAMRLINAVAGGVLFGAANAFASREPEPARLFAAMLAAQLAFGAVCQLVASQFPTVGLQSIFVISGLLALPILLATGCLPRNVVLPAGKRDSLRPSDPSKLRIMSSLLLLYIGTTATWTYLERIGIEAQLPRSIVHRALAVGLLAGLAGGLLAWRIAARANPRHCILGGLGLVTAGLVTLQFDSAAAYAIGGAALNLGQVLALPFFLSLLAAPPSGERDVVLAGPVISLGLILGPLFGAFVAGTPGYALLLAASAVLVLLATMLMTPATVAASRS